MQEGYDSSAIKRNTAAWVVKCLGYLCSEPCPALGTPLRDRTSVTASSKVTPIFRPKETG